MCQEPCGARAQMIKNHYSLKHNLTVNATFKHIEAKPTSLKSHIIVPSSQLTELFLMTTPC